MTLAETWEVHLPVEFWLLRKILLVDMISIECSNPDRKVIVSIYKVDKKTLVLYFMGV